MPSGLIRAGYVMTACSWCEREGHNVMAFHCDNCRRLTHCYKCFRKYNRWCRDCVEEPTDDR